MSPTMCFLVFCIGIEAVEEMNGVRFDNLFQSLKEAKTLKTSNNEHVFPGALKR